MATLKDRDQRDFRLISAQESPQTSSLDFNKLRVGGVTLRDDVFLNTDYKKFYRRPRVRREDVIRAIDMQDIHALRDISNYWFVKSGIYARLCRYMAYLYRYDWFITPIVYDEKIKPEKVIEGWYKSALLLDNCKLKMNFGEIALDVIKNGCYYGYTVRQKNAAYIQKLPVKYCRSRYKLNNKRVVEFNLKYFDDNFSDIVYRTKIIKMFPKEIQKAYLSYKRGTLKKDFNGDDLGWFVLDPACAFKFSLNGDIPLFIAIIPKLMDLEEAQGLDKDKMKQQLIRLIIQEMPIDKNGDLIFDVDEAQALHSNAVKMVGDAVGIDVLTTFADVKVEDLADHGNVSSVDQLDKVERTVYNEAGVSQMQFNTNGNIALEKSIANDEATMTNLLLQFEDYAEELLKPFNKNINRLQYKVQMLPTTIYNFKDLSKIYKEQTQIGFSKLLPQVALGQSQSTVLATAIFENDMLHLEEIMVPPMSSNTMSAANKEEQSKKSNKTVEDGREQGGRPELPDDEKSEKTIRNRESMS